MSRYTRLSHLNMTFRMTAATFLALLPLAPVAAQPAGPTFEQFLIPPTLFSGQQSFIDLTNQYNDIFTNDFIVAGSVVSHAPLADRMVLMSNVGPFFPTEGIDLRLFDALGEDVFSVTINHENGANGNFIRLDFIGVANSFSFIVEGSYRSTAGGTLVKLSAAVDSNPPVSFSKVISNLALIRPSFATLIVGGRPIGGAADDLFDGELEIAASTNFDIFADGFESGDLSAWDLALSAPSP